MSVSTENIIAANLRLIPVSERVIAQRASGNIISPLSHSIICDLTMITSKTSIHLSEVHPLMIFEEWHLGFDLLARDSIASLTENFETIAYMYKNDDLVDLYWYRIFDSVDKSENHVGSISFKQVTQDISEIESQIIEQFANAV